MAEIMTVSTGNVPGRIFMSYRREDTDYPAAWLYERLASHFSGNQVFKDIDSIELGDDFVEVITIAVESSEVLLALIGNRWLTAAGRDGQRRLDDSNDFVRVEIEAALTRGVRVIPVLVEGAQMPRADELPKSLTKLVRRQALELSPSGFAHDAERLLRVLDPIIAKAQEQAPREAEEAAAKLRRQIEQLQGQIRDHSAAQDWDAVPAVSDQLAALDPGAADPDGLASAAREQITWRGEAEEAVARRQRQTEQLAHTPTGHDRGTATDAAAPPPRPTRVLGLPSHLARTLGGHGDVVFGVAFSPDGRLLATADEDGTARLWDPATGQQLRALTGHDRGVLGVAFSPDGRLLATASRDYTARLWDPATGKCRRTLTVRDEVQDVAFRPDGRLLATANYENTASLWDPATGEHLRTLTGHGDVVWGVAFSPDGRLLATASEDKTARLWDPGTGEHLRTLTGHSSSVRGVAFSPDGRLLATASFDKTARLWD